MNLALQCSVLVLLCVGAHCQLTCNKCTGSLTGEGDCSTETRCKTEETRCMAIKWAATNTYTTRCASTDDCSFNGITDLCEGKNCEARCCTSSKCNPFALSQMNIIKTPDRTFYCYQCSRESLDSCISTDQKCDDDQDACISFLIEGGNFDKVYTKRCARKDECTPSELDRLCAEEKDMSNRKQCRASCCFDEMCNQASLKTIPLLMIAGTVLLAMFVFN